MKLPSQFGSRLLKGLALGAAVAIVSVPFLWMVSTSFKTNDLIHVWPPKWFPNPITGSHYRELLSGLNFGRMFFNSAVIALSVTGLSLFLNSLGGYVFAKFRFPLKGPLFALFLVTLMAPAQATMIPVFLLLKWMGFLNSYLGLIIPAAASVFGIFLMRQYMMSVPDAYVESGRVDGCSEFGIFWIIVLPLCRPALAALAIFTFIGVWSDFMMPLIVMQRESMYTLPVALANLSGQHIAEWGLLMAGSVVTIAPILVVFLILQRRFIEGIAMTGLKE